MAEFRDSRAPGRPGKNQIFTWGIPSDGRRPMDSIPTAFHLVFCILFMRLHDRKRYAKYLGKPRKKPDIYHPSSNADRGKPDFYQVFSRPFHKLLSNA